MGAELRMTFTILGCGSVTNTVGEDGFEAIEVFAGDVGSSVCDETGQSLAHALTHDASLAMIHGKTFFHEDRGNMSGEAIHMARKCIIAGKGQVVGVTRVANAR